MKSLSGKRISWTEEKDKLSERIGGYRTLLSSLADRLEELNQELSIQKAAAGNWENYWVRTGSTVKGSMKKKSKKGTGIRKA